MLGKNHENKRLFSPSISWSKSDLHDERVIHNKWRPRLHQLSHGDLLVHLCVGGVACLWEGLAARHRFEDLVIVDDGQVVLNRAWLVQDEVRVEQDAEIIASGGEPLGVHLQLPFPGLRRVGRGSGGEAEADLCSFGVRWEPVDDEAPVPSQVSVVAQQEARLAEVFVLGSSGQGEGQELVSLHDVFLEQAGVVLHQRGGLQLTQLLSRHHGKANVLQYIWKMGL